MRRVLRAWLAGERLPRENRKGDVALSKAVLREIPDLEAVLAAIATPISEHAGEDGSVRLLLRLVDGSSIESVLLPREGLCVSTQVGCAVGCTFCCSGRAGLLRNLTSAEILAQVVLARQRRPIRRVVFMGMGEP
ncbi:MAG: radical SAM protein, partial [Planctomycetota bacterium]